MALQSLKNQKKCLIFTSTTPLRTLGGSTDQKFYVEFDFLSLKCNHDDLKLSEAKNLQNMAVFEKVGLFLRGFWLLAALKEHGRTPNQENRILHENS